MEKDTETNNCALKRCVLGQKVNFDYPMALQFHCTKCGICCGDTKEKIRRILLLSTEAEQIAAATSQQIPEFAVKIDGKAPYSYEMKKTAENGKCVFLEENCCTIYSLRPLICRFYPFELKIAANRKHKFLHTDECPGIGKGKTLSKNYFEALFQLACTKTKAQCKLDEEKR
jgi:Fe-S-cluster containining protein